MSTRPHRASNEFFLELVKGSQPRPGFLAEREKWLRALHVDGREELLFEFEMLLRGIERFFNLHNLPLDPSQPVVTRDFRLELEDVRDAIDAAIKLARTLLDPPADQKLVFRRYVETQLADDSARRDLIEQQLDQDSPQESLFVLRLSLDALRTIVDHLLKLDVCPYPLFSDVGTLALREIVLNHYFRPFRALEFRIEYDRIKSVTILEALGTMPEEERRLFTVAMLALFRILHYLSFAAVREDLPEPRARVILALVKSEAMTLVRYLHGEVASHVAGKRHKAGAIKVSRDISRECEDIWRQLAEAGEDPQATQTAVTALSGLFRAQIVTLARVIDSGLSADTTFASLVSHQMRSARLRRDLSGFVTLCRDALATLEDSPRGSPASALRALRDYFAFFQDVSYHLLRYFDTEAFDRFAAALHEPERAHLADECRRFAQEVDTILAAVNRRSELRGKKLDPSEVEALLARFRPG